MKNIYIRIGSLLELHKGFDQRIIDSFINVVVKPTLESRGYEPLDTIIYTMVLEKVNVDYKETLEQIIYACESYASSVGATCHFIFHETSSGHAICKQNVHYIDTWAWVTYTHSLTRHRNRWYPNSNKALFLVGKPFKLQRIGLLNEFYKNNTLDYLDFTFHYPPTPENRKKIQSIGVDGLSDDMYIHKLLCDLQRPSKDLELENQILSTGFEFTGFPTSLKYYRETCISIVSENSFEVSPPNNVGFVGADTKHLINKYVPYLTEKLFRAIVNFHPFILIGDYGINEYIEQRGYKTFNKFFLPFDDTIRFSAPKTVEWAAKSTKYFIDNKDKHIEEINNIVNHNYNVFMTTVKQEIEQLHRKIPNLNLQDSELLGPL